MNVRVTKLSDNSTEMRTSFIEGVAFQAPTLGERLLVLAESLSAGAGLRYFSTSPVAEIRANGEFVTKSGTLYHFEEIPQ